MRTPDHPGACSKSGIFLAAALYLDGFAHLYWATGVTWVAANPDALSSAVLGFQIPFRPAVVIPLVALLWIAATMVLALATLGT